MEPTATTSPAMPEPIAAAVAAIMGAVKSLPKSDENRHGGYNFASIDAFLSAVGPMCADAGLILIQDEESLETLQRGDRSWLRITYSFVLAHSSGVVWERPMRRSVIQRIDGPQVTGSMQSYAQKQFLRSLFMIPCADGEDSDHAPKESMPARQERQERADPAGRHRAPPPAAPGEPERIAIPEGSEGLQVGKWTRMALDTLTKAPDHSWRMRWLALHEPELAEVGRLQPAYAGKVRELAEAADQQAAA